MTDMLTQVAYIGLGLGTAHLIGYLTVGPLLDWISKRISVPIPLGVGAVIWDEVTRVPGKGTVGLIGAIERTVAFLSIGFNRPEFLAAWLAFKVASKWDAWSNIYKIPPRLEGVPELDYLFSRISWGARTYHRSVIGTSANILVGSAGLGLYALLDKFQPFTVTLP